jgi:pyruvate kinase
VGVESFVAPTNEMIDAVNRAVRDLGRSHSGEAVVVVGALLGEAGGTNTIRVHDVV